MRLDRVVTSIVGPDRHDRADDRARQALDPSIIKTIDVSEGQRVKAGAGAGDARPDLRHRRCRRAEGADRQSRRADRALPRPSWRNSRSTMPRRPAEPGATYYCPAARTTTCSARRSSTPRCAPTTSRSPSTRRRSPSTRTTPARYDDRAKISQEIEQMRATLAAAQVGSRLNLLAATDQKTRDPAQPRIRPQRLVESAASARCDDRDARRLHPAMARRRPARSW